MDISNQLYTAVFIGGCRKQHKVLTDAVPAVDVAPAERGADGLTQFIHGPRLYGGL